MQKINMLQSNIHILIIAYNFPIIKINILAKFGEDRNNDMDVIRYQNHKHIHTCTMPHSQFFIKYMISKSVR